LKVFNFFFKKSFKCGSDSLFQENKIFPSQKKSLKKFFKIIQESLRILNYTKDKILFNCFDEKNYITDINQLLYLKWKKQMNKIANFIIHIIQV